MDVTKRQLGEDTDIRSFIATTFGLTLPQGHRLVVGNAGIQLQPDTMQPQSETGLFQGGN